MRGAAGETLLACFPTALGTCGIAWRTETVVATNLPEVSETALLERLAKRSGAASEGKPPAAVKHAIDAIIELLDGGKTDLRFISCDYGATDAFRIRIYEATREVQPGETTTYGDIAEKLGNKRFAQSVGQAMGRNPLPIIVPCHRVMGTNGKLTGFSASGGIETKLRLLQIEGAAPGDAGGGLFGDLPLSLKPGAARGATRSGR